MKRSVKLVVDFDQFSTISALRFELKENGNVDFCIERHNGETHETIYEIIDIDELRDIRDAANVMIDLVDPEFPS